MLEFIEKNRFNWCFFYIDNNDRSQNTFSYNDTCSTYFRHNARRNAGCLNSLLQKLEAVSAPPTDVLGKGRTTIIK